MCRRTISFPTEVDAAASYLRVRLCDKCGRWHGSGKRPEVTVASIAATPRGERSCFSKSRYNTESQALRPAERYGLRVYRCELCSGFHLTSKPSIYPSQF